MHNRQTFGTRYEEHRAALADLEPELEFGRDSIKRWLLRNDTRIDGVDKENLLMGVKDSGAQVSSQRLFFQELKKSKSAWESEEGLKDTENWLWVSEK